MTLSRAYIGIISAQFIYLTTSILSITVIDNIFLQVFNFWLMDVIFNGFWHKYIHALAAIPVYDWNLWNLMTSRVFPKVAKCEMFIYGPSGSPKVLDILCVLPLNILNEKLFAVLYVWFLFIAMLAAINILYRLLLVCCPELRLQLLRTHLRGMPKAHVRQVLSSAGYGDWFVLMSVSINVNPTLFRDLLEQLYMEHANKQSVQSANQPKRDDDALDEQVEQAEDRDSDRDRELDHISMVTDEHSVDNMSAAPAVPAVNVHPIRFYTESQA